MTDGCGLRVPSRGSDCHKAPLETYKLPPLEMSMRCNDSFIEVLFEEEVRET
jgi:hypothetical protein